MKIVGAMYGSSALVLSAQRSALSARRRRSSWDARPHDERPQLPLLLPPLFLKPI
jgi:hypothetical protein